ncbi:DUF493 domain-containing protein [Mariprofundus sp. EBB-1]|uniref:HP0495 family protein n=1 Tax=Mariprofundus sp. EBB-1 TaxID=2650971 RepID=UPI000EF2945E|nr:DUF493 domain-containing protein [Mariprofundus sp. EBB-1]RLL52238.1 DUF493 domain-containing protein [Mariprofundus sp. EBB-1]
MSEETLLEFPCQFPIKAMGTNHKYFENDVVMIVRKHTPNLGEGAVTSKPSRTGKYLAVTVTITATSKAQIDAIYQTLHAHPDVKMVL